MTFETKMTLIILYFSMFLVDAQLLFSFLTTRNDRLYSLESFLYSKCSLTIRLLAGTTQFLVMICTMTIGYQQIMISILVNSLVFTHNLVQHRRQKCISLSHVILIIVMALYYLVYLITSIKTTDPNMFVTNAYPVFVSCNTMIVVFASFLYVYSICLVKKAINQSSNYNFKYRKSFIMLTLYVVLIILEGIYLMTF